MKYNFWKVFSRVTRVAALMCLIGMLSGCGMMSMFETSPTLELSLNLTPQSNDGHTLTMITVPMSRAEFLQTGYQEALRYVGKEQTHMATLTPEQFDEGDYTFTVPAKLGQGIAVFVLFTHLKPESQWKQFVPEAYGKEYFVNVGKHTINNFTEDD